MRIFSGFCVAFLKGYQWFLAPIFYGLGIRCRFVPSCSDYAIDAVKTYGPVKGSLLAVARLARCHPFCKGGFDPIPARSQCLECSNG